MSTFGKFIFCGTLLLVAATLIETVSFQELWDDDLVRGIILFSIGGVLGVGISSRT